MEWVVAAVVIAVLALVAVVGLVVPRRRRELPPPPVRPGVDYAPGVGDDVTSPRDTPTRTVEDVLLPPAVETPPTAEPTIVVPAEPAAPELDRPAPVA